MTMPGRNYSSNLYRYGFGKHERSLEINENSYTAEYWQFDARIGRRWNIDPVIKDDESPYMTYGNNPIVMVDPNGADWYKNKNGNVEHRKQHGKKGDEGWLGNGKTLTYEGYYYDKNGVSEILDHVSVTSKAKSKKKSNFSSSPRHGGIYFTSNTKEDVQRSIGYHAMLRDRHNSNQPLIQDSDPQDFKDNIGYYERSWQANQDWRTANYAILDGATFFVPVPKVGMLRWVRYGGRTFQEAKVAIWAKNAKPVFQPIRDVATGKTFKVYAEIHHRFVPQRWGLPNWITNSRFNLQITNSIEHGLIDPFRHQFFPRWVKEGIKEGTISAENVIRLR